MPATSVGPEGNQHSEPSDNRFDGLLASLTVWISHLHLQDCHIQMYIILCIKLKIQLEPCALNPSWLQTKKCFHVIKEKDQTN